MATETFPQIAADLHPAFNWIDSAGEWDEALSDESYAAEAAANAVENDQRDVSESDLREVIALVLAHETKRAAELGAIAGENDVEAFYNEEGIDAVRATLEPGHLDWDEGAINAGAARSDGVRGEAPRQAYYAAYAKAATALAASYAADEAS